MKRSLERGNRRLAHWIPTQLPRRHMGRPPMVLALLLCAMAAATVAAAPSPAVDTQALHIFYNATAGASWTNSTKWLEGDPCENQWYGVVCVEGQLHVLDMGYNNLQGTLPPQVAAFHQLRDFDVDNNEGEHSSAVQLEL
eukprot:5737788-Pleurochrysis_carterae.AAC.1